VNHRILTATLIVSIKSISAFCGDLNYVQKPKCEISDVVGRVAETALTNPNISIEVGHELITNNYNIKLRNEGLECR